MNLWALYAKNFIEKIRNVDIPDEALMGSFDVVNLFTTTPVTEALQVLRQRLEEDDKLPDRTHHSVDTLMEMVTVCTQNTYFQFGTDFYKQVRGMAMGSPLSPVLCNIYLEHLENRAINSFITKPILFCRYVDDIFFVWPEGVCSIEEFHTHLNAQSTDIKFTIEKEVNGTIPFLDVLVKRNNHKLETEVYRKATDSGLYLQYDSNHPKAVKNGIVNTMLHRAETHSSTPSNYNQEVKKIDEILIRNKYPPKLIKNIKEKRKNKLKTTAEEKKPDATIVLPYIPRLSEKIKKLGNKNNIRVVFKSKETIKSKIVNFKPKSKKLSPKEVIYNIPCECGKSYIGETGRTVEVRLKEHQASVKKCDPDISKLTEHKLKTGHRFKWEDVKVIGKESNWRKRKIHEAAEILKGADKVISTPSFEIDPVWRPLIHNTRLRPKYKATENPPVRRSARLRARVQPITAPERTTRQRRTWQDGQ